MVVCILHVDGGRGFMGLMVGHAFVASFLQCGIVCSQKSMQRACRDAGSV